MMSQVVREVPTRLTSFIGARKRQAMDGSVGAVGCGSHHRNGDSPV